MYRSNIPPRRKEPKKEWSKIYQEQRNVMLDIIEKAGTVGQALLKIKLGWGDGVFNRRKAEIIELFPGFINWNSKTKIFTWIKLEQKLEQPIIQEWEKEL